MKKLGNRFSRSHLESIYASRNLDARTYSVRGARYEIVQRGNEQQLTEVTTRNVVYRGNDAMAYKERMGLHLAEKEGAEQ